jgi:hypothetical protein
MVTISDLKQQLQAVVKGKYLLEQQETTSKAMVMEDLFSDLLTSHACHIRKRDTGFYSLEIIDEQSGKDMCTVYTVSDWKTNAYSGFEFSYYSTNIKLPDPFQNRRFKVMSGIMDILSGDTTEVLSKLNDIDAEYDIVIQPYRQSEIELTTNIRLLEQEQAQKDLQDWLVSLKNTGLKRDNKFDLKVGFNRSIYLNELKITDWSASGKTATVEVGYHRHDGTTSTTTESVKKDYLVHLYHDLNREKR